MVNVFQKYQMPSNPTRLTTHPLPSQALVLLLAHSTELCREEGSSVPFVLRVGFGSIYRSDYKASRTGLSLRSTLPCG